MSTKGIETILTKAIEDPKFADALFADPEKALAGFDLTAEEIAKFKDFSRAQFDEIALGNRKAFSVIINEIVTVVVAKP